MAKPEAKRRGKLVSDSIAIFNVRQIKFTYSKKKIYIPKNPHSSAITEKIKSVCGSGKNPY